MVVGVLRLRRNYDRNGLVPQCRWTYRGGHTNAISDPYEILVSASEPAVVRRSEIPRSMRPKQATPRGQRSGLWVMPGELLPALARLAAAGLTGFPRRRDVYRPRRVTPRLLLLARRGYFRVLRPLGPPLRRVVRLVRRGVQLDQPVESFDDVRCVTRLQRLLPLASVPRNP